MTPTIYIFGNIQVFQAALTGIQMIFNPSNNTDWAVTGSVFGVGPIVTIGLLISLMHLATKGVWMQKIHLHHVGIMLGLYAAMFVPQTQVQVQDIYSGQTFVASGIPIGVAYPASIVSQLAYDAATQLGQAFQSANATNPTTNVSQGFAEPLEQMLELRHLYQDYVKTDPGLANDEFAFMQQCVYPLYSQNTTLQEAYEQSADIFATLTGTEYGTANATIPGGTGNTVCPDSTGCVMTCDALASSLQSAYTTWVGQTNSQTSCQAAIGAATSKKADTVAPLYGCDAASTQDMGQILASIGSSGQNMISQMIHTCMATAGMSAGGTIFGGASMGTVLPSYCTIDENTFNQTSIENAGAASMFLKNMLPMMSVLQFLFIALAPLAAFTMVIAGAQGLGMFVKYIMFGLWTQSWLPVAALLNAYTQITMQHQLSIISALVTGSPNAQATVNAITLNGAPATSNVLNMITLPAVLETTMRLVSNADMLLALTPVITMIVFTGSYMGMAQLAQDIGGENNVGKNTGLETPGVSAQEQMLGVQATGNPAHAGLYSADNTMNAISIGGGSQLMAGVQGTAQEASVLSQSAQAQLAITRANAIAELRAHAASISGSSTTTNAGGTSSSVAGSTKVGNDQSNSVAHDLQTIADGAYAFNLDKLLGNNKGNASKGDMEKMEKMAQAITAGMLKDPNSMAAMFEKAGLNGLAALVKGFSATLKGADTSKLSEQATHDYATTLTTTNSADFKHTAAGQFGLNASDTDSLSRNASVNNAEQQAVNAQKAYSDIDQMTRQGGFSSSASVAQTLNGAQILTALVNAGNGSAGQGARNLLSGTGLSGAFEANLASIMKRAPGMSNEQAAVSAYAMTVNSATGTVGGLEALSNLYSRPGMIGQNSELAKALPRLSAAAEKVAAMKKQTDNQLQPGLTSAQQNNATNELPDPSKMEQRVNGATSKTPNAASYTPTGVYKQGSANAQTTAKTGEQGVTSQYTPLTSSDAFNKLVQGDPALAKASQSVNQNYLTDLAGWLGDNPRKGLATLALANTGFGFATSLAQSLKDKGERAALEQALQKTAGSGGGTPPSGGPGGSSSPDDPDKPFSTKSGASSELPNANGQDAFEELKEGKITPKEYMNAVRTKAESAARARAGGAVDEAAVKVAGQEAADGAAKLLVANEVSKAGVVLGKNATTQEIAAAAAASGFAEPVAMVIEGATVVMNADTAASILQTGYELYKSGALSAGGAEVMQETVGIMKEGLNNAFNAGNNNLQKIGETLNLKAPSGS